MPVKVLIGCEFSGTVREAFSERGHHAVSCDLLPSEIPGEHYQGDVRDILNEGWDVMIAHPPCTYLSNVGVQHLHLDPNRWQKMENARDFFLLLLNAKIPRICIENPVPHRYAKLPPYTQIIHPYYYGHNVSKKTCLWLKNLPLLRPTNMVDPGERYVGRDGRSNGSTWYQLAPSKDRGKFRSRTFQGIADAMAEQWGGTLGEYQASLSTWEVCQ